MAREYRGQLLVGVERESNVILDVEASLFAHILDVVCQVAYKTLFAQFGRDRRFKGDDVASLFGGDEARTSSGNDFDFVGSQLDLLTIDGETQCACLVE